ncbi:unnamed protein product [Ectocarpus sp. 8 AP-2014]
MGFVAHGVCAAARTNIFSRCALWLLLPDAKLHIDSTARVSRVVVDIAHDSPFLASPHVPLRGHVDGLSLPTQFLKHVHALSKAHRWRFSRNFRLRVTWGKYLSYPDVIHSCQLCSDDA